MTDEAFFFVIVWLVAWIVLFGFAGLAIVGLSSSEEDHDIIMRYETDLREAKEKEK